eukprot:TRINITY_DN1702_c0_g1_i1.p1 TRINITY_DN1702_c0_g1~~TRINITY_DN1702_c0_g1_i1.p1  ORF type:complete len:874 (-),score=236.12 TRINITY_DN1702_c0_g1_i1:15-2393(-)
MATGYRDVAILLIQSGGNISVTNARGATPLHNAAAVGDVSVIRMCLEFGASINTTDHDGRSPLHAAAAAGRTDAVRLLVEQGAETGIQDSEGNTALHLIASIANAALVQQLIEVATRQHHSFPWTNYYGDTPLHVAAAANATETLPLWLSVMDANVTDMNGRTPLHAAASSTSSVETLKLLLRHGADVNASDTQGLTPLHLAATNNNLMAARTLCWKSANVAVLALDGDSALHKALRAGAYDVAKFLATVGADVNIVARDGWNAHSMCMKLRASGHISVAEAIEARAHATAAALLSQHPDHALNTLNQQQSTPSPPRRAVSPHATTSTPPPSTFISTSVNSAGGTGSSYLNSLTSSARSVPAMAANSGYPSSASRSVSFRSPIQDDRSMALRADQIAVAMSEGRQKVMELTEQGSSLHRQLSDDLQTRRDMAAQLAAEREELRLVQLNLRNGREQHEQLLQEIAALREERLRNVNVAEVTEQLTSMRSEVAHLTNSIEQKREQLEILQRQVTETMRLHEQSMQTLSQHRTTAQHRLDELNARVQAQEAQLHKGDGLEKLLQELDSAVATQEQRLQELHLRNEEHELSVDVDKQRRSTELQKIENKHYAVEGKLATLLARVQQAEEAERDVTQRTIAAKQRLDGLNATIQRREETERSVKALEEQLADKERTLAAIRDEVLTRQEQLRQNRTSERQLQDSIDNLRGEMDASIRLRQAQITEIDTTLGTKQRELSSLEEMLLRRRHDLQNITQTAEQLKRDVQDKHQQQSMLADALDRTRAQIDRVRSMGGAAR